MFQQTPSVSEETSKHDEIFMLRALLSMNKLPMLTGLSGTLKPVDEMVDESEERHHGTPTPSPKGRHSTVQKAKLASQARAGTKSKHASKQEGLILQSESPV